MTKRTYARKIAMMVDGKVNEVEKANGIKRFGITIKGEGNVAPCVYIDEMYEKGVSVEEAAEKVKSINKANHTSEDMDVMEQIRPENLRARLYNEATKVEVYRKADGAFSDLIIVPVINVKMANGTRGSIKLNERLLVILGMTADEAIDAALENSAREATMQSMVAMVAAMMNCDVSEVPYPNDGTMVLTTESQTYGAIALISKAKELAELFPNGYVVLPSSVHEVIVRELDMDPDELSKLVQTVNAEQVDSEEQLSNHAYVVNAA